MKTPDDVAAMSRLKACGWGIKRIARELGCSHHTVKHYVGAGEVVPFSVPRRPKMLGGHEDWLRERFPRHRGNADVVRQEFLAEKGLATLQRALQPYRQAMKAEALATIRFETPPGRQLQIDFGERLVEIGSGRVKALVFVATLSHSRRCHVRAFHHEKQESWFSGLESAFLTFGGVPEEVLMDNPRALVVRHDAARRTVTFNDKLIAFARHWGFTPRACAPFRARTKGKTESGVGSEHDALPEKPKTILAKFSKRLSKERQTASGYRGKLYTEHAEGMSAAEKERRVRSSLDNNYSFWPRELSLIEGLRKAGFRNISRMMHPSPFGEPARDFRVIYVARH